MQMSNHKLLLFGHTGEHNMQGSRSHYIKRIEQQELEESDIGSNDINSRTEESEMEGEEMNIVKN